MRAFLSHSSKNKNFVKQIFDDLGSALAEFDQATFSAGQFNFDTITEALARADLFVIFATPESLASGYVEIETKLALEALARKNIRAILPVCINLPPTELPDNLRVISAALKIQNPHIAAGRIRTELIKLDIKENPAQRPFIGRDEIKQKIIHRLSDPERDTPAAIALSGVDGVGRRTLARKVLQDVYPFMNFTIPTITMPIGAGLADLYRDLVNFEANFSKQEYFEKISHFDELDSDKKLSTIANAIESVSQQRQFLFFLDEGGILNDDGSFTNEIASLCHFLARKRLPHPPICFILFRTPPAATLVGNHIEHFKVGPLAASAVRQLISLSVKHKDPSVSSTTVERLVELVDGHPYNIEFVLRLLENVSLVNLLKDPVDLIAFKQRRGDEFIKRVNLSTNDKKILAILRVLAYCPFDLLIEVAALPSDDFAVSLRRLEDLHCIDIQDEIITINRPLRNAFERSALLRMTPDQIQKIQMAAVDKYQSYQNADNVSVPLISSAARAAVFLNTEDDQLSLFLLPSNRIFVGKRLYDSKRYDSCIGECSIALRSPRLLTKGGKIEAIRLKCLSHI